MADSFLLLAQAGSSGASTLLFMGALFAIMYFVMIRPQQKQLKQQREMLAALKKGDDVVTQGGLMGRVYAVADKIVTLEISNGVRVRVLKNSVQGKVAATEEETVRGDEKKEEK